jgi:hypothetical protein
MNNRPVEAAVLRRHSHPIIINLPIYEHPRFRESDSTWNSLSLPRLIINNRNYSVKFLCIYQSYDTTGHCNWTTKTKAVPLHIMEAIAGSNLDRPVVQFVVRHYTD